MTIDRIGHRALGACAIATLVACSQSPAVPNAAPLVQRVVTSSARADAQGCPLKRCLIVPSQGEYNQKPPAAVLFFARNANHDAPPVGEISGSKTKLVLPSGLAMDSQRNIYVANHNSITVYAAGSEGNVAPIRTIAGANTQLISPGGIALDSQGELYVANDTTQRHGDRITVYASGANGDVAPIREIHGRNTRLYAPWGLGFDSKSNLYVANSEPNNGWITVYSPNANGDAAPIREIRGKRTTLQGPSGLAVDASGYVYVVSSISQEVAIFAPNVHGDVAPVSYFSGGYGAFGIGVGDHDIYVTSVGYDDEPFVEALSDGSLGNKGKVLRKIQGENTKLVWPESIIVR